eukprot:6853645-Prymnesium_polylepis.1
MPRTIVSPHQRSLAWSVSRGSNVHDMARGTEALERQTARSTSATKPVIAPPDADIITSGDA